jgi:pyruvate dehydrogenase phosphatase
MRRAAIRAFRTARLAPSRSLPLRARSAFQTSNYALSAIRHASGRTEPAKASSSMYVRRVSIAVVSGLVGYGAWFVYRGNGDPSSISASQAKEFTTSSNVYSLPLEAGATEVERKAVIVGADSLYTGAIAGDGPISKDTDDAGRKVLEMLTPEQATQKLRRNEESYLVGRGKGVVRYDVVQIPSNDPIEDDHSEKIIELPTALATATAARNPSSDWMFWGVFDGHSYVHESPYPFLSVPPRGCACFQTLPSSAASSWVWGLAP